VLLQCQNESSALQHKLKLSDIFKNASFTNLPNRRFPNRRTTSQKHDERMLARCMWKNHRNLCTRTRMFEVLLQTFWAKKKLVKCLLITTLDKVIYNIGTFSQGSTKPLFTSQNRADVSRKKICPFFFQHACSRSRFLWEEWGEIVRTNINF
jgi:hypothetical protein